MLLLRQLQIGKVVVINATTTQKSKNGGKKNEYINNNCLNSEFKVDDFRIVKVM